MTCCLKVILIRLVANEIVEAALVVPLCCGNSLGKVNSRTFVTFSINSTCCYPLNVY